jgi:hypothetical protein
MASTLALTRNHLVFGLCLPRAVLMGYLLTEPPEAASPQVPQYLFMGIGCVISPDELSMAQQSAQLGDVGSWVGALLAGDYHNGLLSLAIPLGIYGIWAFSWCIVASIRVLNQYFTHMGHPNRGASTHFFSHGSWHASCSSYLSLGRSNPSCNFLFTGIMGLAVSLNASATNVVGDVNSDEFESNDSMR